MVTKKRTVSVRLDPGAERRLEKAATLTRQSRGAFLEKAGDEMARRILLDWAVSCHRQGSAGYSDLAEATGRTGQEAALEIFLASCETVARTQHNPEFLRMAKEAVQTVLT